MNSLGHDVGPLLLLQMCWIKTSEINAFQKQVSSITGLKELVVWETPNGILTEVSFPSLDFIPLIITEVVVFNDYQLHENEDRVKPHCKNSLTLGREIPALLELGHACWCKEVQVIMRYVFYSKSCMTNDQVGG